MKTNKYNDILIESKNHIALIFILFLVPFLMNVISVDNIDSGNTNSTENHLIEKEYAINTNICNDTNPFLLASSMPFLSDEIKSNFNSCASGGPGSASCSLVGICSVSCWPGYYACCSIVFSCRCIKAPNPDPSSDPEEEGPP